MTFQEMEPWFWFFVGFFAFTGASTAKAVIGLLSEAIGWLLEELAWKRRVYKARKERREREEGRVH